MDFEIKEVKIEEIEEVELENIDVLEDTDSPSFGLLCGGWF